MSTDPKFSNSPPIPHGEPDVFESEPDKLPESDQPFTSPELATDSVTHLALDAASTRQHFLSKQLRPEPDRVDFSDRITASRRTGYIAFDADEFTAGGGDEAGSMMARFQRLQCDISQLVAEVEATRREVAAKADGGAPPSRVAAAAVGVCRRLTDAHLQRLLGADVRAVEERTEAMAGGQSRLLQQLEAHRAKKGGGAAPAAGQDPRGSQVVCEMYSAVDKVKSMEQAKFSECEQRIQRLENLLGPPPPLPRFSLDSCGSGSRPLVEAAQRLNARASELCEGSFLTQMEARLGTVHAKLGQVTQKKEAVAAADTENKVAELFEIVKKWEAMIPVVPQLVDRLEAVKVLHEQAMQFSQSVAFVENNQTEVEKLLKQHAGTVKKVETALSTEIAKVQTSCDALAVRVKAVK